MTHKSMLAYIVPRFTNQVENVATDALLYMLRQYPLASRSLIAYVANLGISLSDDLIFDSQLGLAGGARPDLTGVDKEGDLVLAVESKFWATLTKNQPNAYLDLLAPDKAGMVLVIAPASRFPTLWEELVQRCADGDLAVKEISDHSPEYRCAEVGPQKLLCLASWESLLAYLKQEFLINDVTNGAHEVWQLQGLCERLDEEAFHPLRPENLQFSSDSQVEHFRRLVDDLISLLVKKGYASTKGYRATPSADYYKRYMNFLGNANWCIEYNQTYWSLFQISPIWLTVTLAATTQSLEKIDLLRQESPSRLIEHEKQILIPLDLSLGAERTKVLESMVHQIVEIEPFIGV